MRQTLLLIKASQDVCNDEIDTIRSVSSIHQIDTIVVDLTIGETIENKATGHCFDLIYLCGHGNFQGMGTEDGSVMTWDKISQDLCQTACTKPGATVFCACCRGGLLNAAISFFKNCGSVGFVVGPRSEIYPQSIILGFHAIMYNILFRKSEPDDACDAAYKATGKKFIVHDAQQYLAEGQLVQAA